MIIYLDNKYSKCYSALIAKRKDNPPEGYFERHHILPQSLGGTNDKTNLVKLTAREHFICHRLLIKMLEGAAKAKMVTAAHNMIKWSRNKTINYISSRSYELLRAAYAQQVSDRMKALPRKPHTAEWKAKMSIINTGRKFGPEHSARTIATHTGRKRSAETKAKIKQKRDAQVMPLKEWHLLKPDGTFIKTLRLKEFCQANKLGLSKLRETMITKQPVDTGYSTGWMIVGFEKLTSP
jgi:hypothetical protein